MVGGSPDVGSELVGEVEARLGGGAGVAVGPEDVEIGVGDGAAGDRLPPGIGTPVGKKRLV
jgi:hypothetical protein